MNDKRLILDDFEHENIEKYETKHLFVSSYSLSMHNQADHIGTGCLRLDYDFSGWQTGNGAMYIHFKEQLITHQRPVKLSLWVHGDGDSPWLRATLIDGEGERKIINLTDGAINWHGWKYVDASIDSDWPLPLQLEQIYLVETDKRFQGDASKRGRVCFDHLCYVYVDDVDLIGPTFTDIAPQGLIVYQDAFSFSTIVHDAMSGVDPMSIRVLVNGKEVKHNYNEQTGELRFFVEAVDVEKVNIQVQAADLAGNWALPPIDTTFEIDLSPDYDPPVISNLTPTQSINVRTNEPRITFHVIDEKSGVDSDDIVVLLNRTCLDVVHDEVTGWCYSLPHAPLVRGKHQLIVYATDRAGNTSCKFERRFYVDPVMRSDGGDVRIAVIPDTHTATYARFVFDRVSADPADMVLHMGDMVEQARESEFKEMQPILKKLQPKPVLALAGNHETFQDNLNLFFMYVGLPTFHLTWSHTLMIVLNTSYEQSIRASDSTQFHYLEQLLQQNTKQNVIIATHVPTRDRFGTSHQMVEADAQKLESILSTYKKNNPSKRIRVLFGHLHVLDYWQKDHVDYIITGNGARKGYVAHDKGNVFGYGVLHATPHKLTYEFNPFLTNLTLQLGRCDDSISPVKRHHIYPLTVLGHFNALDLDYTVDITNMALIKKQWTSSDENILTVDSTGNIQTQQAGIATIQVKVQGVVASLTINVN